jgi:hypothetical protein
LKTSSDPEARLFEDFREGKPWNERPINSASHKKRAGFCAFQAFVGRTTTKADLSITAADGKAFGKLFSMILKPGFYKQQIDGMLDGSLRRIQKLEVGTDEFSWVVQRLLS